MPITSLVVECGEDRVHQVETLIGDLKDAEAHERHGRFLVVVTDTDNAAADRSLVDRIGSFPGVIAASPVFSCFEDQPSPSVPSQPVSRTGAEIIEV